MNQIEHWKARETGLPADAAYHNRLAKRLDSGLPGHLGMELVEVPDEEFPTLGCNVLAVGPKRCVMVAGNPVTRARLEAKGIEVHAFSGHDICLKGSGGPTCLTRPLRRRVLNNSRAG